MLLASSRSRIASGAAEVYHLLGELGLVRHVIFGKHYFGLLVQGLLDSRVDSAQSLS